MGVYLLAGLLIRAVVHRAVSRSGAAAQRQGGSRSNKVLLWTHVTAQLLATACLVWAICVGHNLLIRTGKTFSDAHPGFGLAIASLVFLQIILGFVHHTCFGRRPRKLRDYQLRASQAEEKGVRDVSDFSWPWEIFRFLHRYLGRIIFICFFINIVVGLHYADEPAGTRRSVTAAVAVALGVFLAAVLFFEFKEHKHGKGILRTYCKGYRT